MKKREKPSESKGMKTIRISFAFALVFCLFLCGSAAASNVTDCSVSNTNIYAGSSVSTISPAGTFDSESCESSDITNDKNVYVRPLSLNADISSSVNVLLSTITQGALVDLVDGKVIQTPYLWNFGTGEKQETYTPYVEHTYPAGEYAASVTVSNYLDDGVESQKVNLEILYAGYDSYTEGFSSVLSLIIVAGLIVAVILLLIIIRTGGGLELIIPVTIGFLSLIVVLIVIVGIAGTVDNIVMGALS